MIDIIRSEKALTLVVEKGALEIDNATLQMTFSENEEGKEQKSSKTRADAVLGAIRLISGYFLVYVSKQTKVCSIPTPFLPEETSSVFCAEEISVIPFFSAQLSKLSKEQKEEEEKYLTLLKNEFNLKPSSFYYSDNPLFDLTRTIQAQTAASAMTDPSKRWESVDGAFAWNTYLMEEIVAQNTDKQNLQWFTPVMRGKVQYKKFFLENDKLDLILLSRLSWKRVGTRHNTRGIDVDGFAANFVETEQIVSYGDKLFTYLEIRGSIPVVWTQTPTLAYKPPVVIDHKKSAEAFNKHAQFLLNRYNHVCWINLVDQKGSEKRLADEFEKLNKDLNNQNSRYVMFDFHKETKGMKYERISMLIDKINDDLQKFGYFFYDGVKKQVVCEQKGVCRVNCVDSLDRTNVVQSIIAKKFLAVQLAKAGVYPEDSKEGFESIKDFGQSLKYIWADNGDAVSFLYAGTTALKGDFTRTGKRTLIGSYYDFVASAKRYFFNNFTDGHRQDALNLITGKYRVKNQTSSPFAKTKGVMQKISYMFFGSFFVSVGLIVYRLTQAAQGKTTGRGLAFTAGISAYAFIMFKLLTKQRGLGEKYVVNQPKLLPQ